MHSRISVAIWYMGAREWHYIYKQERMKGHFQLVKFTNAQTTTQGVYMYIHVIICTHVL